MQSDKKNVTKNQVTESSIKGNLTFDDKVIQKIIGIALEKIDGLLTVDGGFFSNMANKIVNTDNVTSGIDVEVGKKQVAVDLDIVVEYGKNITDIYGSIKKIISQEIKNMTGLEVIEVNVNVVDMKSREQYEKEAVTVQDKASEAAKATGDFTSKEFDKAKEGINEAESKVSKESTKKKKERNEEHQARVE